MSVAVGIYCNSALQVKLANNAKLFLLGKTIRMNRYKRREE